MYRRASEKPVCWIALYFCLSRACFSPQEPTRKLISQESFFFFEDGDFTSTKRFLGTAVGISYFCRATFFFAVFVFVLSWSVCFLSLLSCRSYKSMRAGAGGNPVLRFAVLDGRPLGNYRGGERGDAWQGRGPQSGGNAKLRLGWVDPALFARGVEIWSWCFSLDDYDVDDDVRLDSVWLSCTATITAYCEFAGYTWVSGSGAEMEYRLVLVVVVDFVGFVFVFVLAAIARQGVGGGEG